MVFLTADMEHLSKKHVHMLTSVNAFAQKYKNLSLAACSTLNTSKYQNMNIGIFSAKVNRLPPLQEMAKESK